MSSYALLAFIWALTRKQMLLEGVDARLRLSDSAVAVAVRGGSECARDLVGSFMAGVCDSTYVVNLLRIVERR
ncbi:hypothetical protein FNV43_RR00066 [Rhamnella rubrinervis]|uniref:Secreted protein n=1 Tax=Rhamnella rubrinervis TaxID=2594499 RepID=A0A8K0HNH2_9ROSA|nr:hypothetical protein FNV43_RR00066 [Rhamnella rubrinervis]